MAQDAFNLRGRLSLDSATFNANIAEAQRRLNTFGGRVQTFRRNMARDFNAASREVGKFAGSMKSGLLVSGALVAGFAALASKAFSAAEEIKDLADAAGLGTTEFQGLKIAFEGVGLEAKDVSGAFMRVEKAAQGMVNGVAGNVDAFKKLGLSAKDLLGKDPSEIFYAVADAAASTTNVIQRNDALMSILGRNMALKLTPALLGGAQGFRDVLKDAEALGVVMSERTIQQAHDAAGAFDRLQSAAKQAGIAGFAVLAVHIGDLATKLTNIGGSATDFEETILRTFENSARVLAVFGNGIRGIKILWEGVGAAFLKLKALMDRSAFGVTDKTLESWAEADAAAQKFHETLMQDLPTQTTDKWLKDMRDKLQSAPLVIPITTGSGQDAGLQATKSPTASVAKHASLISPKAMKATKADITELNTDITVFAANIQSTLSTSLESAFSGDFKSIGDHWKKLLQQMAADAIAADITRSLGLSMGMTGGKENSVTGQDFFTQAISAFGGMGGSSDNSTSSSVSNTFNISTPNASSFKSARGRISSDMNSISRTAM